MIQEVGGTIEWAKGKIGNYPKAKRDLGPLLDALGREFCQRLCLSTLFTYTVLSQNPSLRLSEASVFFSQEY
jgi:hypothetical protein